MKLIRQNVILIFLGVVLLTPSFFSVSVPPSLDPVSAAAPSGNWWDTSYSYRQPLEVSTGANSPLNGYDGYTARILFDTSTLISNSKMQLDCDDLRILYWTGAIWSELDRHVIDCNDASTDIRFQLQADIGVSSIDDNYYLYYGNTSAVSPPSNLSNVYLWYDDASVDDLSSYIEGRGDSWHGTGHTDSFSHNASGWYDYDTGDNNTDSIRVPSATLNERDAYIEVEFFHTDAYAIDMSTGVLGRYTLDSGSGATESSDNYYASVRADSPFEADTGYSNDVSIVRGDRTTVAIGPADGASAPAVAGNQWRKQALALWGVNDTNGRFWDNDTASSMGPVGFPSQAVTKSGTDGTDVEGAGEWGVIAAQDAGRVRNILIRRYTDPEPTVTAQDEEVPPTPTTSCSSSWFDTDWAHRKKFILRSSETEGALTDFPVLISLASDSDLAADALANADDIFFTLDSTGAKLSHEIESFDSGTGELVAWVKLPSLSDTSNTDICMYYANGTAANQEDVPNVWSNGFSLIHHLQETPTGTSGDFEDSTSNNNDATSNNMEAGDQQDGQINGSIVLDGVNETIVTDANYSQPSTGTISLWINDSNAPTGTERPFGMADGWEWRTDGANIMYFDINLTGINNTFVSNATIADGTWKYVVAVFNVSSGDFSVYIDGQLDNSGTAAMSTQSLSTALTIGNRTGGTDEWEGQMDELRISTDERSADWVETEYNNQSDPVAFHGNTGAEEDAPIFKVEIVDAGGTPVVSPTVSFSAITISFDDQTTTGTFGVSAERLRVTNTSSNPEWSLSLAATGSSTAFWDGTNGDFDFNDPTSNAGDGGDADALGGQLTVDPSVAAIAPEGGCSSTGLTLGSNASFDEGVIDSVTIVTAGGSTDTGCYWDFTDIDLSQSIPPEQISDSYDIDMTLTLLAI